MKLMMAMLNLGGMSGAGPQQPPTDSDRMDEDHDHSTCTDHDHHHEQKPKETPKETPTEEPKEEVKGTNEALAEKEKGNALFKQKKFDEALIHYNKAAELDPNDITYKLNIAAAKIEQGKFDEAIKVCEEAVEFGRANRAEYKLIGRALERMGNAYFKQKDYKNALKCYTDSLTEEKSREVTKKKQQTEQLLSKQQEEEYKSPEKAEECRLRGNELFKQQKYPEAMKEYNEAIKRDPTKANFYFNRCVCFLKLGEPNYALKDAEKAIEIDPKYTKALARKGQCHVMRKEYHRAVDTYKQGLEIDPENAELKDGLIRVTQLIQSKSRERDEDRIKIASQDPEIMMMMNDPVMKQVLSDFSEHPADAQRHLQNPQILAKIEKLIAAGIIQTG
jgi:stress-induced-phosphoprotein 1